MIKTTDRFATVQEYIEAHDWAPYASQEAKDAMASLCYKRNGVWYRARNVPKGAQRATAWYAFTDVKHALSWGMLPSYKCNAKVMHFFRNPEETERYSRLFDEFLMLGKKDKALRLAREAA